MKHYENMKIRMVCVYTKGKVKKMIQQQLAQL